MRRSVLGAALLLALGPVPGTGAVDSLRPIHGGTREKGAIIDGSAVDGLGGTVEFNDRTFTELTGGSLLSALFPVIPLDDLGPASHDEAIAFAGRRPPVLVPAAWTAGNDSVVFSYEDEYRIAVQVWIVEGPFDEVSDVALDASVETSQIWSTERQGLAFEAFDVVDATADPDAPDLVHFDCGKAEELRTRIGFVPDRLNVYYVSTVSFAGGGTTSTNGVWCGGGTIAMGAKTLGHLLAHELGHAFDLKHVDASPQILAWFDETNVMHPASGVRRYLTEGQTFRAVFSSFSALNGVAPYGIYDVRPGQPLRTCPPTSISTTDPLCPAVQKRIWADGIAWPPN
jgi:hypothetical protein